MAALNTVPKRWFRQSAFVFALLMSAGIMAIPDTTRASSSSQSKSGFTVSPAVLTTQIGSKQPTTTTSFGVRNDYTSPITISARVNGFDVRNNALVPSTIADTSLADSVSISQPSVIIPAQSSKNITITVHDSSALTPGGHYLSILLTQASTVSANGISQLALHPAVSVGLYIIKEDGALRQIKVSALQLRHSLFSLPQQADVTFTNNGNVVVIPHGVVTIAASAQQTPFRQGIINDQSVPLYPQAQIKLRSYLKIIQPVNWPGKYIATIQYRYEGDDNYTKLETAIWYIPKITVVELATIITMLIVVLWPTNRQKLRSWWRRRNQPARHPFVAPKAVHSAPAQLPLKDQGHKNTRPQPRRRKIDIK